MKKFLVVWMILILAIALVGCGKKKAPTVTTLPTQVIKQNVDDGADTAVDEQPEEQEAVEQQQPQEVFDPEEFEASNDEIEQLVDILEELIEEQES